MHGRKNKGELLKVKTVLFATGSRADYGIVRNYLRLLEEDKNTDLNILVTGALLSKEYGHQVDLIYKDGFQVGAEIDIPIDPSSNKSVVHAMAAALDKFGIYFAENTPDLLIILGDRYEILSVATAAAMNRIPILHLHGGETTFGNYDEFIRHAITKMSLFHITATEEFKNRVIQLGEEPDRVYNLGSLGAENCLNIEDSIVPLKIRSMDDKGYFVVLFHPETLTNNSALEQVMELLRAIDDYDSYKYVFLGSNSDTNSNVIREKVKDYVGSHDNCLYFENLPTAGYHYLLKHSLGLIGNSSSGLIEAPSLKVYTINIGDRQKGRVRGNSVLDVRCNSHEIGIAIEEIVNVNVERNSNIINPYYKANAAKNYYETTKKILSDIGDGIYDEPKEFYDI